MDIKLFDSELRVMDIIWKNGDTTAKEISQILAHEVGWSKTTTYTVIKKCVDKGAIERRSNFLCHALITRDEAREFETEELINKMYDGAADQLVASLIGSKRLSKEEIAQLKKLVDEME